MTSIVESVWNWYVQNRENLTPLGAVIGGGIVAWAALRQAATARGRHREQTEADRQRRITESFGKAVEQLGSDKIEVRLGGIYALERVSRESFVDYLAVMETLTAFVRERARWQASNSLVSETMVRFYQDSTLSNDLKAQQEPQTDIAAVLTVMMRRRFEQRKHEMNEGWHLDLSGADLGGATLPKAPFQRAIFRGTYFKGANLVGAHLEEADLSGANLKRSDLSNAHLEGADLRDANFKQCKSMNLF